MRFHVLFITKLRRSPTRNVLEFHEFKTALDLWSMNVEFHDKGGTPYIADFRDWDGQAFSQMYHGGFVEALPIEAFDLVVFYGPLDGSATPIVRTIYEAFVALGTVTVSDYQTMLHNRDKLYLFELEKAGIRIPETSTSIDDRVHARLDAGRAVVAKPRCGARTEHIYFLDTLAELEALPELEDGWLYQEKVEGFSGGEFSLLFLGTEFRFGWVRQQTEASKPFNNMCRGGRMESFMPTSREVEFGQRVVDLYEGFGLRIDLARVDYVRSGSELVLNEIEVFTPAIETRFDTSDKPFGLLFARRCMELL